MNSVNTSLQQLQRDLLEIQGPLQKEERMRADGRIRKSNRWKRRKDTPPNLQNTQPAMVSPQQDRKPMTQKVDAFADLRLS